jgi:hypothetical protein
MVIGQTECFLLVIVIAAAAGLRRGWGKEVITCAIILATVLFLTFGGADWLGNIFASLTWTVNNPQAAASGAADPPPPCSPVAKTTIEMIVFGGMTWFAYWVGKRYGTPPKQGNHHIAGIIPGAINGAVIAYYVSNQLLAGKQLQIYGPTDELTSSYLPEILGLALLGLLIVLFFAAQASKGGGGSK